MDGVPCVQLKQCMATSSESDHICTVTYVIRSTFADIPLTEGCRSMFDLAVMSVLLYNLWSLLFVCLHIRRTWNNLRDIFRGVCVCVCTSDLDLEVTSHQEDTNVLKEVHYSHFECVSSFWSPWKQFNYSCNLPSFASTACYCSLSISIIWMAINWWNSGVLTAKNINLSRHIFLWCASLKHRKARAMCRLCFVTLY